LRVLDNDVFLSGDFNTKFLEQNDVMKLSKEG
ncbi:hypothetical protein, partial [Listeria monocytogenes]